MKRNSEKPMKKKRFRYLRILMVAGLLLIGLIAFLAFMNFAGRPRDGQPLVRVSRETTVITEPLDDNGDPDYITYMNQKLSAGVTPENNAVVLIVQAVGPKVNFRMLGDGYFQLLGIEPLPSEGDYLIEYSTWKRSVLPELGNELSARQWDDLLESQFDFAMGNPWTAEQFPELAKWMDKNREPTDLLRQATLRQQYYDPLDGYSENGTYLGSTVAGVRDTHRPFARSMSLSAMKYLAEGNVAVAFEEVLAIRRSARLLSRQPTLVDCFVAISVEGMALNLERKIAQSGIATKQQLMDYQAIINQLPSLPAISDRIDNSARFEVLDGMIRIGRGKLRFDQIGLGSFLGNSDRNIDQMIANADWGVAMQQVNPFFDRLVAATKLETFEQSKNELAKMKDDMDQMKAEFKEPFSFIERVTTGRKSKGRLAGRFILSELYFGFDAALYADTRSRAERGLSLIALSLAAFKCDHDKYPDRLDQLVAAYCDALPLDPFIDEPFHYHRTTDQNNESYLLYSVGENMQDDAGVGFSEFENDLPATVTFEDWNEVQQELRDRWEEDRPDRGETNE
jgi:hypothetical protein